MNNVIGIDIGGSHFRLGLFDAEGRRLLVSEGETSRSGGRDWMLGQIGEKCRALLRETDFPVKACGISFGGPVDFERQRVKSVHTPGWEDFPLSEWVQETLGMPSRVDNDANAGALGEARFGAGVGAKSIVYITLSTGIGAGLICDGQVFRGKDSLAGELGHIPVSDADVICPCGARGCLEAFCSGAAIAQRGREWAERRSESAGRLLELSGGSAENISAHAVAQAALEGDTMAVGILSESAKWLARALLTVIRIMNPDKIILGGGVAQAGQVLMNPVRGFLRELGSPSIGYSTEIVVAALGTLSPLYGAAALALDLGSSGGGITKS